MSILNRVINGAKSATKGGGRGTAAGAPGTGGTHGTTSGGRGLSGMARKILKR